MRMATDDDDAISQVTYITALFPYVIMVILLVQGLRLEGSSTGIMYYITPQWNRLLSAKVIIGQRYQRLLY